MYVKFYSLKCNENILITSFKSPNRCVFRNIFVSNTRLMRNVHFRLIHHIGSFFFISFIFLSDWICNMSFFFVYFIYFWLNGWIELIFLFSKTVKPIFFRSLIISNNIMIFSSKIFFSQFQRPFNLNLFHTSVFFNAFDVRSVLKDAASCIQMSYWAFNVPSMFPFVTNVNYCFWFRLQ